MSFSDIWTGYKRINSTHFGNQDHSFPLDAFHKELNTSKFAMIVVPNSLGEQKFKNF